MGEQDVRSPGVGQEGATAGPQGVGREPTTPQPGVDQETEPTAAGEQPQTAQPEPAQQVNLDDIEEYRRWKSASDRRISQAEQRAQQAEQRAAQMASRLEELELRNLRPDEREAFYKTKLAEERAAMDRERAESEERQRYIGLATSALTKLGLQPDTPGLDWGDKPSAENYAKLMESAAALLAERARNQTQAQAEQTEEQLREARTTALREAGVSRTSVATSGAPPESNPIKDISDPNQLLRMGAEDALKRATGRQPPRG